MQNSLFFLPIYSYSRDKYYKTHKTKMVLEKGKLKDQWSKNEWLTTSQINGFIKNCDKKGQFDIPLWKFNNVVGYLDIGMDGSTSLTADIYLKRKNFPTNHRVRQSNYFTTLQNNEFLDYAEINKIRIDIENNNSFISGLSEILNRAKKVIKKRNSNFQLWIPPFNFECFNFVEAYKQIKN